MNKFVFSALAASVVSATGIASETEWPELDRELEALSTTIQTQTTSPFKLSGWVGAAWDTSGDITFDVDGVQRDFSGFDIRTARLRAEGDVRNYGYRLEFDFGSNVDGTGGVNGVLNNTLYTSTPDLAAEVASLQDPSYDAKLLDAWGAVTVAESFKVTMGRFRQPFTQSGLVDRNRTLFIDRTVLGDRYAVRDEGAMLSGKFSMVGWYLAAQNGLDDRADEYLFTGRVTVDILGEGAGYNAMTAYGAPEGTNVTVAAAFGSEGAVDQGDQFGGEVYLTSGPFFLGGEIVSLDDGLAGNGTTATPWDIIAAYLIANQYEIAIGWQEFDRSLSTTDPTASDRAYTAAVNWYHDDWDTKWTLQWQRLDSRDDVNDADVISVGLTVSF